MVSPATPRSKSRRRVDAAPHIDRTALLNQIVDDLVADRERILWERQDAARYAAWDAWESAAADLIEVEGRLLLALVAAGLHQRGAA